MKILNSSDDVPVYSWCSAPEAGAITQIQNAAKLPTAYHHVALMPDAHQGYGAPIGGVMASLGAVIPNFVGVDIACGMQAVMFDRRYVGVDKIKRIMGEVRELIPMGMNHNAERCDLSLMPDLPTGPVTSAEFQSARCQLGTLGGGNHFIEFQVDETGYLWAMLHSGSRNVGKRVCDTYNAQACLALGDTEPAVAAGLAYIAEGTALYADYMQDMRWCMDFAKRSRTRMMDLIIHVVSKELGATLTLRYDIHHNYAAEEEHYGTKVLVHRKGATRAGKGELGIIPGSQGTASYIVKGKGVQESWLSCSHGAGRKMSRAAARKTLDLKKEQEKLDAQGIVHSLRTERNLDEASSAYKDISVVMSEQADLVDIVYALKPVGVLKA